MHVHIIICSNVWYTSVSTAVCVQAQEVEEVEAERDGVLGAICRVKEKLQSVTDEICVFDSSGHDSGDHDRSNNSNSNDISSTSSGSSGSKGSFFEDIQRNIRHKESELQSLR
jgi:hypothetical protein